MKNCYLGLGSNLKSPQRLIRQAIKIIVKHPLLHTAKCSSLYNSKPWGIHSQPDYYNAVVEISTKLPPKKLLAQCQMIEKKLGRVRKKRWGPRAIDIDILLYGNLTLTSPHLSIPHKQILNRDFVLKPLLQIAPELKLDGKSISSHLAQCKTYCK